MMDIAEIRKKAQMDRGSRREESRAMDLPPAYSPEPSGKAEEVVSDDFFSSPTGVVPAPPPVVRDPLTLILEGRKAALLEEVIPAWTEMDILHETAEYLEILCFRVADEIYGIDIMELKEIIKPRETTEIPHAPPFIAGVISLRGIIIPVILLRERLGLLASAGGGKERIIVVNKGDGLYGILVDEVIQVVRIAADTVEQPPAVLEGIDRDFVAGIGRHEGKIIILLAMDKVLDVSLL